MRRVVSLFLPSWSTDRLRKSSGGQALSPELPLAIVGHDGRRRAVVALDAVAHAAGLRLGMAASKAQVLVPGLQIEKADERADGDGLEKLALWALRRYSPVVAVDGRDGLVLDVTGADHLHGGEDALLRDLTDRVTASKIDVRAAIADSWGAAHALARFSGRRRFSAAADGSRASIEKLPVAALRLAAETVAALHTIGFTTVRDVLDQPRAPLTLRFGPELGPRLDQALGLVAEPIETIRAPEIVEVSAASWNRSVPRRPLLVPSRRSRTSCVTYWSTAASVRSASISSATASTVVPRRCGSA